MEPIKPELPWHSPYQYGDILPEAMLIEAIITKAYEDSNSQYGHMRQLARDWFYTREFEKYCELLRLDPFPLREQIIKQWSQAI